MPDFLEGIADADARLGGPFPLPERPLPLTRWVAVHAVGEHGAQVEWNFDDSRSGTPGRLVLYAGDAAPPAHALLAPQPAADVAIDGRPGRLRTAPLAEAQASLRPVTELEWADGNRHLRLTAQGPWPREELVAIAASVPRRGPDAAV